MQSARFVHASVIVCAVVPALAIAARARAAGNGPNMFGFADPTGIVRTYNLPFLATVMWDGRERFPGQSIHFDLSDQANGATLGHAVATHPLTREHAAAIVDFESGLFAAQSSDNTAGVLDAQGGAGGPNPAWC
jgi:hypothetical protein